MSIPTDDAACFAVKFASQRYPLFIIGPAKTMRPGGFLAPVRRN